MLSGNLSTRPFYNERLVTLVLLLLAAAAVALTAYNVTEFAALRDARQTERDRAAQAYGKAEQVRAEAAAVQRAIDRASLQVLLGSTQEANRLIDQRTFSWTVFFGLIEETLPIDVRLVSVSPRVEKGVFKVATLVVARAPEDLDTFVENLLGTGAFYDVFLTGQQRNEDGTFAATVEAGYLRAGEPPAAPAPASPAVGRSGRGRP